MRIIQAKERASSRKVSHMAPRSNEDLIALLLEPKAPWVSGLSRRWGAEEFFYLGSRCHLALCTTIIVMCSALEGKGGGHCLGEYRFHLSWFRGKMVP